MIIKYQKGYNPPVELDVIEIESDWLGIICPCLYLICYKKDGKGTEAYRATSIDLGSREASLPENF